MTIGEHIFELLEEKKISQKAFSERTGIAQSTISDWKRKKTNPAADKIMIICDVLDVTPYELLSCTETAGKGMSDYFMVGKGTDEYVLLEKYRSLKQSDKGRIWGYMQSLWEKKK